MDVFYHEAWHAFAADARAADPRMDELVSEGIAHAVAVTKGEAIPDEYRALFLDKWPDVVSSMKANASATWSGTWNNRRAAAVWADDEGSLKALVERLPANFSRRG